MSDWLAICYTNIDSLETVHVQSRIQQNKKQKWKNVDDWLAICYPNGDSLESIYVQSGLLLFSWATNYVHFAK